MTTPKGLARVKDVVGEHPSTFILAGIIIAVEVILFLTVPTVGWVVLLVLGGLAAVIVLGALIVSALDEWFG